MNLVTFAGECISAEVDGYISGLSQYHSNPGKGPALAIFPGFPEYFFLRNGPADTGYRYSEQKKPQDLLLIRYC